MNNADLKVLETMSIREIRERLVLLNHFMYHTMNMARYNDWEDERVSLLDLLAQLENEDEQG